MAKKKAPDAWEWDAEKRRYRHVPSRQLVQPKRLAALRDQYADTRVAQVEVFTSAMTQRGGSVQAWVTDMRASLKASWGASYMLGRGGRAAMTKGDWLALGRFMKQQYAYLDRFARQVQLGDLSARQVEARATLYANAITYAHERGKVAAYPITLPVYPADGGTECLVNCRCHWAITSTRTEWRAIWKMTRSKENCQGCQDRARLYADFRMPRARSAPEPVLSSPLERLLRRRFEHRGTYPALGRQPATAPAPHRAGAPGHH